MAKVTHVPEREDEPHAVELHRNAYFGGTALIVLGGPSAADWQKLYESTRIDVLIGVNGVGANTDLLDYWLCAENMNYPMRQAWDGNQRYKAIADAFQKATAKTKLVNKKSYHLLGDQSNTIKIQRQGVEVEQLDSFDFREYGDGLINGALMQRKDIIKNLRAGTVALQALHWAGILGCDVVHTIGFDLCFKSDAQHHWYDYPLYIQDGKFFYGNPFTKYAGLETSWFWVDTVKYMAHVIPAMQRAGLEWQDHSDGLLQAEGLL